MLTMKINLFDIKRIEMFLNVICQYEGEFILSQGKRKVNAKNVEEIFMLDLTKPVMLQVNHLENGSCSSLRRALAINK